MPQPPTPESEAEFVANAERLLRQGEPLLAYNVADTGLQRWPALLRRAAQPSRAARGS